MSYHTHEVIVSAGVTCDKRSCYEEHESGFFINEGSAIDRATGQAESENYIRHLKALGWTFWAGARTGYTYCPKHSASPTSQSLIFSDEVRQLPGGYERSKMISATCHHDLHDLCDTVQRVSNYRPHRRCDCDCHQDNPLGEKSNDQ